MELVSKPFNEIEALKGLVRVLTPIVDDYVARLAYKDSAGDWQESTQPAIYLGYLEEPSPAQPRIHITFNGNTDINPTSYEDGLMTIEDPTDPPNEITVPFKRSYIDYIVTLTCDAGGKDKVNRGDVMSSNFILSRIRDSFLFDDVLKNIHSEMNSTTQPISEVTPVYDLIETSYHDSSVMRLTFSTTNTIFNYDGGCFDTIVENGELYRYEDDPDPLVSTRTVTSVTP